MEKLEWRDVFKRQPAYYLFIDLVLPMSLDTLENICVVVKNITSLSVSLRGTARFNVMGVYAVSGHCKCIFPLQTLKNSCMKLQISMESLKSTHAVFSNSDEIDTEKLTECLRDSVQQYEKFYQSALPNKEEWPQLEMLFFSSQSTQKISKIIQESLCSIHLDYIRKVQVVILKSAWSGSSSGAEEESNPSPQIILDEAVDLIRSLIHLTEMEGNTFQLEKIFKSWLLDTSNDTDHLRLTINSLTLRCDLRECLLSCDALPVAAGQFNLVTDTPTTAQPTARPGNRASAKVPIYNLEALCLVKREGLCGSLLYGQPYIAIPTKCWKVDWEELERNQQHFGCVVRYLLNKELVILAKRQSSRPDVPCGLFAFFPSASLFFLVKSVAANELLLPRGEPASMITEPVPENVQQAVSESLTSLEQKEIYNPLGVSSGLYTCLTAKAGRMSSRPQFLSPLTNNDKQRYKRKLTTAEVAPSNGQQSGDFVSASALIRNKFPTKLE